MTNDEQFDPICETSPRAMSIGLESETQETL